MELTWIKQWHTADDIVVWIDVAKLNEAWRRDEEIYYISKASAAFKCLRFGEWVKLGHPIWMPHVAFNEGVISFTDGRHRFAWLRDNGVRALPVTSEPECAPDIQRELGTRVRRSILDIY